MKRYYNFETSFRSLKEALTVFLKEHQIYYEVSSLYPFAGWHFEILCTKNDVTMIDKWLDSQTIQEVI